MLQVEALAQLGGIVMIDPADAVQQNNFFFGGVDNCRWRKPVVPGDVLVRPGGARHGGRGGAYVDECGRGDVMGFMPGDPHMCEQGAQAWLIGWRTRKQ